MTDDLSAVLALCERQNALIAQMQRDLVSTRAQRDVYQLACARMVDLQVREYPERTCQSCPERFTPHNMRDIYCPRCEMAHRDIFQARRLGEVEGV